MPMTTFKPFKLSAMYHLHKEHGASIAEENGWKCPAYYTSPKTEVEAAKSSAGMCDVSPMGKFSIQGHDLATYLPKVVSQAAHLGINKIALGTISDNSEIPLTVCHFAQDEAFATCSPDQTEALSKALDSHLAGCAHVVDMTSNFAGIALVGPAGPKLLSKLTDVNITPMAFPNLSDAQGKLAEVYAIILRSDMGQLPAYQLFVGRDFGAYVWEAMLQAGHELGVAPIGVTALHQLGGGR